MNKKATENTNIVENYMEIRFPSTVGRCSLSQILPNKEKHYCYSFFYNNNNNLKKKVRQTGHRTEGLKIYLLKG